MVQLERFRMVPLEKFREELRFEFPNLPNQLFDYYILKTATTMAKKGRLIRRRIVIDVECGVGNYELKAPDGLDIYGIMSAKTNDCIVQDIQKTFTGHDEGRPIVWYDDIEDEINFANVTGPVELIVSVGPSREACELPCEFYDLYLDTLVTGVRAAIMMITGRPWSNLKVGAALDQEFRNMLSTDTIEAATHKMRGGIKMNFGRTL